MSGTRNMGGGIGIGNYVENYVNEGYDIIDRPHTPRADQSKSATQFADRPKSATQFQPYFSALPYTSSVTPTNLFAVSPRLLEKPVQFVPTIPAMQTYEYMSYQPTYEQYTTVPVTTHHYVVPPMPAYFVPTACVTKQETTPEPTAGVKKQETAPEPKEEDEPILFAQKKNKAQRSAAPPVAPPKPEVLEVEKIVVTEKLVEVPTERIVTREVMCEVPVERIVTREKIVEVPVERIVYRDKIVEVPVEKIVQVEKIVEVKVPVDRIVEKLVEVKVPVDKIVQVEKIVEVKVPVDRIVEKIVEVKVPVDRIVEREKIVEVKVEKVVYQDRHVEVPVERIVTREKIVEVPVEKLVTVEKFIEVPGKSVPNLPQAPVITSKNDHVRYRNGEYVWAAAKTNEKGVKIEPDPIVTVRILHSQLDGWQKPCPATLFATCDGSEPSAQNYDFKGPPPLDFRIDCSVRIKAVAIHESTGSSVAVAQEFKQYAPTGIGMVLEQVHGLRGIYVIKVVPGGAAWRANEVLVGDEIRMIDNIVVSDMELDEVTGLILGQPGTEVQLQILREDRTADGKVVDGAGFQFFSTIVRAPLDTSPNPEQMPAKPAERLERWTRVELDLSEMEAHKQYHRNSGH